jgi:acetyltransferase
VLDACGERGIRRAVIESGGFAEFSPAGRELEEQVRLVARRHHIRFVGPNCISVVNMENGLCLPFVPLDPAAIRRGPVSVLAQSGGIAITYMLLLSDAGVGINKVVSMGNKADLDETDYMAYLQEDAGTEVILLYLESVEEGRHLVELAASSPKPVVVHKANVARASSRIAFSHTAALANDDRVVDAALRQAGISRAASFDDAVALVQGFTLPPVRGDNLVVISRSGGHAVVAADTAAASGFSLPPPAADVLADVRSLARADVIALTNPLDLGAIFDFDLYGRVVEQCLRVLEPDAVLLVHTFGHGPEGEASRRLARWVGEIARKMERPVALCAFAERSELELLKREAAIPIFAGIEAAVRALAASRDRHAHSPRLLPLPATAGHRPRDVAELLRPAREEGVGGALATGPALRLCAAFGIPAAEWTTVQDVEEALVTADVMGYPVALKVLSPDIAHKSDVGGVSLNIEGASALREAFALLLARVKEYAPAARVTGVLLQRMLAGGREMIIGGRRDPSFGPVLMCGLGGVYTEIIEDIALRLAPLSREQARDMIARLRGSRLLHGVRGEPAADVEAVVETLLALSQLLVRCPEVIEVEINPLLVFDRGVAAVDARAMIDI